MCNRTALKPQSLDIRGLSGPLAYFLHSGKRVCFYISATQLYCLRSKDKGVKGSHPRSRSTLRARITRHDIVYGHVYTRRLKTTAHNVMRKQRQKILSSSSQAPGGVCPSAPSPSPPTPDPTTGSRGCGRSAKKWLPPSPCRFTSLG